MITIQKTKIVRCFFALCCIVLLLSSYASAQQNSQFNFNDALGSMIDDNTPGMLRVGDIQILYGHARIPCDYPAELCSATVNFVAPFLEKPVVTLTSLSNYSTHKCSYATLVQDRLTTNSFVVRIKLQANLQNLKSIPWMAIGRWR